MVLVRTRECKQGTHVKGGWVENNKGDIVRSRFVAKQRDDVSQTTPALLIFRLLLSIAVSIAPIFCGSAVVLSVWDIFVAFFHAVMDELVYVHPPRDMVPPGPKKLLAGLFLASQVTQVQGDDDSTAVTQHEESVQRVLSASSGSSVMCWRLCRYAKPPVIHVEVGTQSTCWPGGIGMSGVLVRKTVGIHSIPNLCKVPCAVRARIEKCSQVLSVFIRC